MRRWMMAATLMVALTTVAWAQAPADHNTHQHSDSAKSPPPADSAPSQNPPTTSAPQGGMGGGMGGGMPMMGMMKDMKNDMKSMMDGMSMMNAMGMMQTMRMMDSGAGGMATIDRVEGRIAFLRAELKITDAQGDAWNGFADALRANAKKLGEVRGSMMPKSGGAATMADRLDRQEQWLAARLEGTRAIKTAFVKLNESLSDEQRKSANDLLAPHMGIGAMAMMPPQMQRGQKERGRMQPEQTQPGQPKGSHSH